MPEREQKRKAAPQREEQSATQEVNAPSETGDKLKAEMDELLDEIDGVLETNAEEFVKSYIQKGGE